MEPEIPGPPSAAENGAGGGEKGVEGAESANWAENDPSCGAAVETGGSPANQVERDVGDGGHAPAESAPSSGRPATADSDHNGRSTASAAVLLDGSASGGEPPVDPAGVPLTDKSSVLASPHAPGSAGASLQLQQEPAAQILSSVATDLGAQGQRRPAQPPASDAQAPDAGAEPSTSLQVQQPGAHSPAGVSTVTAGGDGR